MPQEASVWLRGYERKLVVRTGDWMVHFDCTGRLLLGVGPHEVVRRGLDNQVVQVVSHNDYGLLRRTYQSFDPLQKDIFYRRAYEVALAALTLLSTDQRDAWQSLLEQWSPAKLANDTESFQGVYSPIRILPPDQYHALVVQITHGCSYNQCLFCDFYRDRQFHIKSIEELRIHLDRLIDFMDTRVAHRTGVFLGDGNAFVVPTAKLVTMMEVIREKFATSVSQNFYTFMDTFTTGQKTPEDLGVIYAHGLRTVYTGLETGSDRLRTFLRKPGTAKEAVNTLNVLKAAGFRLGVIVLVGVGGPAYAEEHLSETRRALEGIHFTPGDIVFLSPLVDPQETGYRKIAQDNALVPYTEDEIASELRRWKRSLAALPIKVSLYSVKEHLYA